MPTSASSPSSRLRSRISCAIRVSVRLMRSASITTDTGEPHATIGELGNWRPGDERRERRTSSGTSSQPRRAALKMVNRSIISRPALLALHTPPTCPLLSLIGRYECDRTLFCERTLKNVGAGVAVHVAAHGQTEKVPDRRHHADHPSLHGNPALWDRP